MLDLENIFTYHKPSVDDQECYTNIRTAAKVFAQTIVDNTPQCADQTVAVRHVRDAVMTANAAVALKGQLDK